MRPLTLLLLASAASTFALVACLKSSECGSNSDCSGADVCSSGACVECEDDGDCGDGEACADNTCVAGLDTADAGVDGPECDVDADCEPGLICTPDAVCSEKAPCCIETAAFECREASQCQILAEETADECIRQGEGDAPACLESVAGSLAPEFDCAPSDTVDCGGGV